MTTASVRAGSGLDRDDSLHLGYALP
jgi:hypothetical protein